jgi:hypothetical protein
VDPQLLATSSAATALLRAYPANDDNDFDKDTSDPDLAALSLEEQDNAMQLLGVVITQIGTTDSVTDGDTDLDLLKTLDKAPPNFDKSDPIHSYVEGFIEYFSRINIIKNQITAKLSDAAF